MTNFHRKYTRNATKKTYPYSNSYHRNSDDNHFNHNKRNVSKYTYVRKKDPESTQASQKNELKQLCESQQIKNRSDSKHISSNSNTSKTWVRPREAGEDISVQNSAKEDSNDRDFESQLDKSTHDKAKIDQNLRKKDISVKMSSNAIFKNGNRSWRRESSKEVDDTTLRISTTTTSKRRNNDVKFLPKLLGRNKIIRNHTAIGYKQKILERNQVKRIELPSNNEKIQQKAPETSIDSADNEHKSQSDQFTNFTKRKDSMTNNDPSPIPALTPFAYRGISSDRPLYHGNKCIIVNKLPSAQNDDNNNDNKNAHRTIISTSSNNNGKQRTMKLIRIQQTKFTPICPHGSKCTIPSCTKRHDIPLEFTKPTCQFFQNNGLCRHGKDCPFRHVKVAEHADDCPKFSRFGYCENMFCELWHRNKKSLKSFRSS